MAFTPTTYQQVLDLIDSYIVDNDSGLITPAKLRSILISVVNFLLTAYGNPAFQTLTYGSTTNWDVAAGNSAKVTLTGATTTLAIANMVQGQMYVLEVWQDATGGRLIVPPAGTLVAWGGAGSLTLDTTASGKNIVTFFYDGTQFIALVNKTTT
jgi:hypothetical protein